VTRHQRTQGTNLRPSGNSRARRPTLDEEGFQRLDGSRGPEYLPTGEERILRLQRAAGNRATSSLLQRKTAGNALQRWFFPFGWHAPTPAVATPTQTSADGGGSADVTNLEQDMRDILEQWKEAAKDGVSQFVTNTMSARLDSLESGSWTTFISSLIGNTIWAAAAFAPTGLGQAVLAFRISMVGIGVAAAPTVPKASKSTLPKIQELGVDYINNIFDQLNEQLRDKATALLKQYPGITRYRALAEFIKASFGPGLYTIPTDRRLIPRLNKSAIRNQFERIATERLDIFMSVGARRTASEYVADEVAWIRLPSGISRLALVRTDFYAGPEFARSDFLRWIPKESEPMAIERWKSHPWSGGAIRVLIAADVSGL
jgi:hypothetical protein